MFSDTANVLFAPSIGWNVLLLLVDSYVCSNQSPPTHPPTHPPTLPTRPPQSGLVVKSHSWERDLGGRDFDDLIFNALAEDFRVGEAAERIVVSSVG